MQSTANLQIIRQCIKSNVLFKINSIGCCSSDQTCDITPAPALSSNTQVMTNSRRHTFNSNLTRYFCTIPHKSRIKLCVGWLVCSFVRSLHYIMQLRSSNFVSYLCSLCLLRANGQTRLAFRLTCRQALVPVTTQRPLRSAIAGIFRVVFSTALAILVRGTGSK